MFHLIKIIIVNIIKIAYDIDLKISVGNVNMKYELIVKHPSVVHIFNDDQKDHYIEIAKRLNGKIRDRKTKKVIYNYCKEEK